METSVGSGGNNYRHFFCKKKKKSATPSDPPDLVGTWGNLVSPAITSPFLSHKPFSGVYRQPQDPRVEGLSPRGTDVSRRLPANAVRATAHVQTQSAADEAANGHHWPGVQKGEAWGETWAFPFSPSCPDSHPPRKAHVTELLISRVPENTSLVTSFTVACTNCTLTSLVISIRPCMI